MKTTEPLPQLREEMTIKHVLDLNGREYGLIALNAPGQGPDFLAVMLGIKTETASYLKGIRFDRAENRRWAAKDAAEKLDVLAIGILADLEILHGAAKDYLEMKEAS